MVNLLLHTEAVDDTASQQVLMCRTLLTCAMLLDKLRVSLLIKPLGGGK
jgi:hypothetical protein